MQSADHKSNQWVLKMKLSLDCGIMNIWHKFEKSFVENYALEIAHSNTKVGPQWPQMSLTGGDNVLG